MSMPVDTGASYADIPVDNHPWSVDDVTFIRDYVDSETAREHTDFFARIPAATGSDGTNVTPYHTSDISPHFQFDTSYTSLPGVPAPSFHSTSSSAQLNAISESVQSLLQQQQSFSNLLRESQRQPEITQAQFESACPVGKVLLFRITLLTIYFVLKEHQYLPGSSLSSVDHVVLIRYAEQAMTRILRSHAGRVDLPPDDGVYQNAVQVITWATRGVSRFVERHMEVSRSTVESMFGFQVGKGEEIKKANIAAYHKAMEDASYLKTPLCFMILFRDYFYSVKGAFAYQFERLTTIYGDLLLDCQPFETPIIPLSQLRLDNAASLTLLVLRHIIEEWSCGADVELEFSTWDVMHARHYYGFVPTASYLIRICEVAMKLWADKRSRMDFVTGDEIFLDGIGGK